MSGQGLTCLGHGTFTNSGQLCRRAALCFAACYVNNMLRVCSAGLGALHARLSFINL